MLFHDIGKPQTLTIDEKGITHNKNHPVVGEEMTRQIMHRLKFDNDTIYKVSKIVRFHDQQIELTQAGVRKAVNRMGEDIFPLMFPVHYADICAQSDYQREEKLQKLRRLREIYDEICKSGDAVSLKGLAVNGSDLIALGMKPGRGIGELLGTMLEAVLEDPSLNSREELLRFAKRHMAEGAGRAQ